MVIIDNCPLCGSVNKSFITDRGEYFSDEKAYLCMNCGLGFLSPRMDEDELKEYYLSDSFSNDFRNESERSDETRKKLLQKAILRFKKVESFLFGNTLLEIGCSSGEFLEVASEKFDVYGIDSSPGYANSSELNIHVGMFPDYDFSDVVDKFDVICTFHTLEHVSDPQAFLDAVYDRLDDDGVFVIEYPDLHTASKRSFLPSTYFQKSHLHDFSTFNINILLLRAGLRINYAAIINPNYPTDKNVIVVCTKSSTGKVDPLKELIDRPKTEELINNLKRKIKSFNVNRKKAFRVTHVASHHINVGDGAISYGIRKGLTSLLQSNIEFISADIVDYASFGKELTAEVIKEGEPDLIIVGGGGTIDGHGHRTQTGTAFTMPLSEMEKLTVPIAFVGLGHNTFPNQEFECADELNLFLEFCRDENIPFSVRRDGSWDRLHSVVDDDLMRYVDVIPDPGYFIEPSNTHKLVHISPIASRNIIIQLAPDAYLHRFGSQQNFDNFMNTIAEYISWAILDHQAYVCFATHTLDDSWAAMSFLNNRIANNVRRLQVRTTGIYHPIYASEFFTTYAVSDLVVGMRGHSVICGTGLRVPTIALSSHDKVEGYMREAGASDWCIPVSDNNLLDNLKDKTNELLRNPQPHLEQVANATSTWVDDYQAFLAKVLEQV